jgi:hypothetical protein
MRGRNPSAVEFSRDGAKASPFLAQFGHLDKERIPDALREHASSLDPLRPSTSDLRVSEPLSARPGSLQGGPDALRNQSTVLGRLSGQSCDRCPACCWHVQSHKFNSGFPQSVEKGGGFPNGSKGWYHERCMMTLSALECLFEMWPSPLLSRFVFGKFFDEFAVRGDVAQRGFTLRR